MKKLEFPNMQGRFWIEIKIGSIGSQIDTNQGRGYSLMEAWDIKDNAGNPDNVKIRGPYNVTSVVIEEKPHP